MCFLINDDGWMFLVALVLRLFLTANSQHLSSEKPTGRIGENPQGGADHMKELKCIGEFSVQTTDEKHDYCTYIYSFPTGSCDKIERHQGKAHVGESMFNRQCCPLSFGPLIMIVCFCNEDNCNSEKDAQKLILNETTRLIQLDLKIFPTYRTELNEENIRLFQCMKDDARKRAAPGPEDDTRNRYTEQQNTPRPTNHSERETISLILLAIIIGAAGLIILIAILIPVIMKIRRYRHKKWLEETWEERVRKAAADLNIQEGGPPNKNSRAGRKALKQSMIKSKEGSKEVGSKEIGSKEGSKDFGSKEGDELFPAAFGPGDRRGGAGYGGYSNEGANRGGAGYGGYSNEDANRGGAGYGGYSNEGANRGGAGYAGGAGYGGGAAGYPNNPNMNAPNINAPNRW